MPKTKKRGGAKAHRKRVQARNNMVKGVQSQMQRMWEQQMNAYMEELKAKSQEESGTVTGLEIPNVQLPNDDENTPLDIKL